MSVVHLIVGHQCGGSGGVCDGDWADRYDTDTGGELARIDLGQVSPGVGRGGGRIRSAGEGHVLRYGGNGPPEKYTHDLALIWRADPIEGLRSQSWFGRDAVTLGGMVWTTPGPGWPIFITASKMDVLLT